MILNQLDKANTNMSSDEFDKKYPYGEQLLEFWQDELADIIGEEECNNYINSVSQVGTSEANVDSESHEASMSQNAKETEELINTREDEGKPLCEAFNATDAIIDQGIINNIVIVGNNEYGAFSERYQKEYDAGNIEIRINDYKEHEFSQDEAVELYFEEQASRNEAVSTIIGALSMEGGLVKSIVYIANALLEGDGATEEVVIGMIDDLTVEITTKNVLKGFVVDKSVELLLNTLDSMNYNVNNIAGGQYIDVKIVQHPKLDASVPTLVQYLRLYEVDGVYIHDEMNPICYAISSPDF